MGRLQRTGLTPNIESSSGTDPSEDYKAPDNPLQLEAEIPRGPGSTDPFRKPVGRSPFGLEAGQSAGGGLNVTVSAPIGGPISGRGGVNIGKDGTIKGGQIGIGIGGGPLGASIDVGTDQDEEGRGGCYQYVTVTIGFFSHTYGKNVCEPKPPKDPSPTSTSPSSSNPNNFATIKECEGSRFELFSHARSVGESFDRFYPIEDAIARRDAFAISNYDEASDEAFANRRFGVENWYKIANNKKRSSVGGQWMYIQNDSPSIIGTRGNIFRSDAICESDCLIYTYYQKGDTPENPSFYFFTSNISDQKTKIISVIPPPPCPIPLKTPTSSPPPPNPSPRRKKMDDKCCKAILLMLLMQHKHLGVSPIPGMESLNKFAGVSGKGEQFKGEQMAFPFEVPKTWLDPVAKKEDKILVKNISELLFIMGSQAERLERVLGTKEFIKDSEGKLRQSEANLSSWLTGKNPDFAYPDPNDFWFNTEDGIIKEKRLEVRNLSDAIRYVVEMGNRLERILPIAELKDSSIPKRWIYPGAKGQERVGNLIHLIELMVRADDKSRGYWPVKVKVKDADPAIKGDQPIELEFHSQADVFRELFQFLIDMEGDGDMSSNFALRSAFQTCQMHQLTVQNNAMLDAIVEYLDFKVNKTTAKVPMPFNPFAGMSPSLIDQALEKLGIIDGMPLNPSIDSNKESDIEALAPNVLQNTLVDVDIVECNESKTLNESLLELLKHASAASAAVSERVSETAIDRVISGAGLAQKLTSFLLRRDVVNALGIGDLDKWVSSAEAGYTDVPESQGLRFPESDPLEPYGRPATQNPKIREIDTKEPKAD